MSECFIVRRGGSGGGLNLSVFGGLDAPSNPKENTLWIKTDKTLTNFLMTKNGTNYATREGSVNIVYEPTDIVDDLTANATFKLYDKKINGVNGQIWVNLLKANVSNGTKHEQVEAFIRKGSNWVQFSNSYLAFVENKVIVEPMETFGDVTSDSTGLVIKGKSQSGSFASVQKKIDLSGYNSLYLKYTTNVTTSTGALDVALGIADALRSANASDWVVKQGKATTSNTVTLDISKVTGEHYVHAYVRGNNTYSGTPRLTIEDMILYP